VAPIRSISFLLIFRGTSLDKIEDIKGAVSSMAEYQDMKAKFAKHTALCSRLMEMYNLRGLEEVALVCQELVMTPSSCDETKEKQLFDSLLKCMSNPNIEYRLFNH
jgi:hypothetical protein